MHERVQKALELNERIRQQNAVERSWARWNRRMGDEDAEYDYVPQPVIGVPVDDSPLVVIGQGDGRKVIRPSDLK